MQHDQVKEYYGKVLQKSEDLKTNACCTRVNMPREILKIIASLHDEVIEKYYGCGLTIPRDFSNLKGLRILDLGSGSGRDCYILSKLVGEEGFVVGVDMTEEQISVAQKHVQYHTEKFGYAKPNIEFRKGYIERLDELGLEEESFDVVISNCVINLSPDKPSVLKGVFKLLKEGGELYFSDVYADRRVPSHLASDPVLWGECLGGALYWNDFLRLSHSTGFADCRLVESDVITIKNRSVEALLGHIKFYSATYRLFKLGCLESACEDYGQAVIYNGEIESCPQKYVLDIEHTLEKGKVFPVCGNTLAMLTHTRLRKYFTVVGDGKTHYGIFTGCGKSIPFEESKTSPGGGCC